MTASTVVNTREELMDLLGLNEEGMAQARSDREAYVHAWQLAQVRKEQGHTQKQLADRMRISQPRIHGVEHGDLNKTTIAVLRAYVEALGGNLEIVAHIRGRNYRLLDKSKPEQKVS